MARKFVHWIQTWKGFFLGGSADYIRHEDLPVLGTVTPGTYALGAITVSQQGFLSAVQGLAAGTYHNLTIPATGTPVTGSTTPPVNIADGTYYSVTVVGNVIVSGTTTAPSSGTTRLVSIIATVGNVGAGEDVLSNTLFTAGILGTNGDVIEGVLTGDYADDVGPSYEIKMYFGADGGPTVFYAPGSPKGVSAETPHWTIRFTIIRESSTVVRCNTVYTDTAVAVDFDEAQYLRITGLTLADAMRLKITATSTNPTPEDNDITLTMGYVEKHAAS